MWAPRLRTAARVPSFPRSARRSGCATSPIAGWPDRPGRASLAHACADPPPSSLAVAARRSRPPSWPPAPPTGRRRRRRLPGQGRRLSHLRRDGRRHPGRAGRAPRHRPGAARSARATRAATSGSPRCPTTSRSTRPSPRSCSTRSTTPASTCRSSRTLALLRWLTDGYGTDAADHRTSSNTREIWIVFAVNPDGAEYDLTGYAVPRLAQEPPAERRDRPPSAPTSTATTATTGPAAAARRPRKSSATYHGSAAFSTPEARVIRDFMASRRIGGRQQIKTAITFHTAGEQILWPYGYTKTDVPGDMTDGGPRRPGRAGQARWPRPTATRRCSRAACTSPTATRSTGRTASERIFMYTFELYPSHSQGQLGPPGSTRPTSSSRPRDRAEQGRDPVPHRARRLPVRGDRQGDRRTAARCSTTSRPHGGWTIEPARHRHGHGRRVAARQPRRRPPARPGTTVVRVRGAGHRADGRRDARTRTTSTAASRPSARRRSRSRRRAGSLTFRYYLAHSSNSSSRRLLPGLRRAARTGRGRSSCRSSGAANTDLPSWAIGQRSR